MAKYPFTNQAAEYVRKLDLKIEDMSEPILTRAEQRIEEALLNARVNTHIRNDEIEIPSFPVAIMMAASTTDKLIKRRYALAEAKRVYQLLKDESIETITEIAENFNWKIKLVKAAFGERTYNFALHLTDFLKNTNGFHEKKWKLVNRTVLKGCVYLTKNETARLLAEEARRHIDKKLNIKGKFTIPENVAKRVERLKQVFVKHKGKIQFEGFPEGVVIAAFPPCIKNMYDGINSGHHLSHIGRFALTSFLINIGMTTEDVINLYRSLSDFNERLTRYQVEHIAGGRGSRTRYIPPRCDTLRTHRVCTSMDEICKGIRHPLAYYRRKLRTIKTKVQ
ncbi:DNA primase large subunit PriL [Candidatus Bathyarchaeota archaeon]|nr:DNA primase large subunit PriL [Candidatus Bathyarchaeota archaeon]